MFNCTICKSKGFKPSITGKGCTFCDGTEGGNPPIKEIKMSKFIYCSECGTKLQIIRKALKDYGRIIDLVNPHECPDEPIDLDLTPTEVPVNKETEGKFVEKLNNLRPSQVNTADLRDRRKEPDVKTSAPASVLQQTKNLMNCSEPENLSGGDPDV